VTWATVRVALYNWLFAQQNGGTLVFRVEDTDKVRSEEKYTRQLMDAFTWLGLDWDEGPAFKKPGDLTSEIISKGPHAPYFQTQRTELYRPYLQLLLNEKKAYWCYCTKEELDAERVAMAAQGLPPKYSGRCRAFSAEGAEKPEGKEPQTIRFVIPENTVEFTDLIKGKISSDPSLSGDMVIAKNLDDPLYHFAVVVDDELMEITHVIRGEDHISNTPKHILLQRALGFRTPEYAHLPIILDKNRAKLSKRSAELSILDYRDKGYLPDAVNNFAALIGWHPTGNDEIFSLAELVEAFSLERVQKSGAVLLPEKLDWLNREHIKRLSLEELAKLVMPFMEKAGLASHIQDEEHFLKVLAAERDRLTTLAELPEGAAYFFVAPTYAPEMLVWREDAPEKTKRIVSHLVDLLEKLPPASFNSEAVQTVIAPLIESEGKGSVLWPLRVALSGREKSSDPFTLLDVLGHEEMMERLFAARTALES